MPDSNKTMNPSYGVRKVNENIMRKGRSVILTSLEDVNFDTLPNGTLYINDVNGTTMVKLAGKSDWQVYNPLNGHAAPTSSEFETLKEQVNSLSALLQRYIKDIDKNSDTINNAATSVNDLVKRTAAFGEITAQQNQQILEVTRKVNESANWKEDLEKESQARIANFQITQGWKENLEQREQNDRAALIQADRNEALARDAADKAEAAARAAADSAEKTARINADSEERAARIKADSEESAAREAQDKALQTALNEEAKTRLEADTQLSDSLYRTNWKIEEETKNRQNADNQLRAELQNNININAKNISDEHNRISDIANQMAVSMQEEKDTREKAMEAEEATRQDEDAALKQDYTTKINGLKLNYLNAEQVMDSQKLDIAVLKDRAGDMEAALKEEQHTRFEKDEEHDDAIFSLQTNVAKQQDDLINEKAERKQQIQTNVSDIKNNMAIIENNLHEESSERVKGDEKVQSNLNTTNRFLDSLVAKGGADAIVLDKLIPPNNYISFVFQDGSVAPYRKNVKTLILDEEENSRTKGLYINGEAALTLAYSDTEYRVYNDTDRPANVRLIFS